MPTTGSPTRPAADPAAPVSIGIIGCGSVLQNAYLPLLVSQVAQGRAMPPRICDVAPERLDQVRSAFEVASATTDPDEIIDDTSLDIVVVLTSMAEHGDLAERALRAGHHVLVEKPMSVDPEQADRLVELDRTGPAHLVCAPHVVLSPDYQQMARLLAAGTVGQPIIARARYGWNGPDWSEWFYRRDGGPLYDLAVYNLTTLTGLLGPCRSVTAMARTSRPQRIVEGRTIHVDIPDTYQLVLELGDGALATVTTAFGMQQYDSPAVEIYGLDGTVQLLGDDWAPDGLQVWRNDVGGWTRYASRSRYWPWTDGLRHLIDCVRTGTRPYPRPAHARHVLEVMQQAMVAARTGSAQPVDSTFDPVTPMPDETSAPHHLVHDRVHEDA